MTIPSQLEITTHLVKTPLHNLSANDKQTLVALSTYINTQRDGNAQCWPTNSRLASITNLSERSIQNSLAKLEKLGYLERQTRYWQDTNSRSRLLVLNLNKLLPTPAPVVSVPDNDEQEEWFWSEDDSQDDW